MELSTVVGLQNKIQFLSDDEARITLGVVTEGKEKSILMRIEYRIKLFNRDWVKAEKHI